MDGAGPRLRVPTCAARRRVCYSRCSSCSPGVSWWRPRQSLNLDTLGELFSGVFSPKVAGPEGSGLVQCSAQCTIQCSVIKTRIFPPILGRNFEVSPEVQEQNSNKTPGLIKNSQNFCRFWGEISRSHRRSKNKIVLKPLDFSKLRKISADFGGPKFRQSVGGMRKTAGGIRYTVNLESCLPLPYTVYSRPFFSFLRHLGEISRFWAKFLANSGGP